MTKKRTLITTALEETWMFDRPVVFLGEWCRRYDRRYVWEKMDAVVATPYGLGKRKKDEDHQAAREIEEKIFPLLCSILNEHHGIDHGERYWRILLGHWVRRFVNVVFNRYQTLVAALNAGNISSITAMRGEDYSLATRTTSEFVWALEDASWNSMLYKKVFQNLACEGIEVEYCLQSSESRFSFTFNDLPHNKPTAKRKIFSRVRKICEYFARTNDVFIISSYLPLWSDIKLQLALRQFPQFWRTRDVVMELLRKVAKTGKPVIMSTGMATLAEIDEAVRVLRGEGCEQLALLKCTSAYPSLPEDMNLRTIPHLAEAFGVPVGLSDHTLGIAVPVAAVALGACIIEKHLTIRRADGGPDAAFSLEPQEFAEMVRAVRVAERALGKVNYEATEKEKASRVFRRSLYVVKDMKQGDEFTEDNVRSIRPGYGLPVKELDRVLGRKAAGNLERGTPLAESHVG